MDVVRVLVVDDDARFRRAMKAVLAADPRVEQVGEAADITEAALVAGETRPTCVLMDVRLPGSGPSGVRAVLTHTDPPPVVVAVSADASTDSVAAMVAAGATGYLLKGEIGEVLVDVVLRCVAGEVVLAAPRAALALRTLYAAAQTGQPGSLWDAGASTGA